MKCIIIIYCLILYYCSFTYNRCSRRSINSISVYIPVAVADKKLIKPRFAHAHYTASICWKMPKPKLPDVNYIVTS